MSAVADVQARIAQIQGAMGTLSAQRPAAATTASSSTAFADALATAQTADISAITATDSTDSTDPTDPTTSFAASDSVAAATAATAATAAAATATTATATAGTGQALVTAAEKYIGVPYVWGSANPATGLDCSGLVQRSMADIGVKVPRVARDQAKVGTAVSSLAAAKPGDLLVFNGGSHIGIYVGDGKMIHAPKPGKHVAVRAVYETPTAIRRVLPEATTAPVSTGSSTTAADMQRYALTMMSEGAAA